MIEHEQGTRRNVVRHAGFRRVETASRRPCRMATLALDGPRWHRTRAGTQSRRDGDPACALHCAVFPARVRSSDGAGAVCTTAARAERQSLRREGDPALRAPTDHAVPGRFSRGRRPLSEAAMRRECGAPRNTSPPATYINSCSLALRGSGIPSRVRVYRRCACSISPYMYFCELAILRWWVHRRSIGQIAWRPGAVAADCRIAPRAPTPSTNAQLEAKFAG